MCFPLYFAKIFKSNFFTEHLPATVSDQNLFKEFTLRVPCRWTSIYLKRVAIIDYHGYEFLFFLGSSRLLEECIYKFYIVLFTKSIYLKRVAISDCHGYKFLFFQRKFLFFFFEGFIYKFYIVLFTNILRQIGRYFWRKHLNN